LAEIAGLPPLQPGRPESISLSVENANRKVSMYQLHYFPANASEVTALPSVRRGYEQEGITDEIC
jgi:hypothetical protein